MIQPQVRPGLVSTLYNAAPGESGFTWQQPANMAEDTREYLDALFQGDSEALQKVNSAWQEESKQGFRGKSHAVH
jgi:hypothetical protein